MSAFVFPPDQVKAPKVPRFYLFGWLFITFYALALAVAPGTRLHAEQFTLNASYFYPLAGFLLTSIALERAFSRRLPNRDQLILPAIQILIGWGILTIWRLSPDLGLKQLIWYFLGAVMLLLALRLKNLTITLKRYKYIWLAIGLGLIALTFWVGVNPGGEGPTLWLRFLGLYIQPSEPLKLLMIIYLSAYFADQIKPNATIFESILPTLVIICLAGMMLAGQRDLGAALIFLGIYGLMLTVTTQRKRFLWLIPLVLVVVSLIGYFALPMVRARIDIWLHPWQNASGSSYQLVQAQIATAAGGLTGTGPGLGSPQIVPVAVSDFIYTAIAEETGLLGTLGFLLILLILIIRGITAALTAKATFGRYLAFGISAYYALQSFLIIGGNLGLVPLTGVTLPFTSYGGSSLLTNMLSGFLLLKISSESTPEGLPEKSRKPYQWMAGLFILLFVALAAKNSMLAAVQQEDLLSRPENPRWAVYDRFSRRGSLLALDEEPLVETVGEIGAYSRHTYYPSLSNTTGYAIGLYGQAGLERSLYAYLRGLVGQDYQTRALHELLYNQPPDGLDIKLNLNLKLQQRADELLGDSQGAVVLLNAKSGEVYVMASHPTYDANRLVEDWETLIKREDAPLLNRATQGAYPLGSLSGLIGLSAYWSDPSMEYDLPVYNNRLDQTCYQAMQATGSGVNPIQYGCQASASSLADLPTASSLLNLLQEIGMFNLPDVALSREELFVSDPLSESDLSSEALKDLRVSPLRAALIASTITNNGTQPTAKIVSSYRLPGGDWQTIANLMTAKPVFSADASQNLQALLSAEDEDIWYQLAHAEQDDSVYTWYLGGTTASWQGTHLAIAVILEENDPELAIQIGEELLVNPPN